MIPRNVRLLAWFNFFGDFRPYAPIAILYFAQVSGSYALGMSIWSVAYLAQSLLEVPTGVFSDRIGRKQTMVCGAFASVLSLVCYAIGGSYAVLLAGAVFEGVSRAFYSGNNDALLYDTLAEIGEQGRFQEYLGKTASMFQVALGISAVIGSLIAAISFQTVMWLSVIPMALAFLISLRFTEPRAYIYRSANVYAHLGTAFRHIVKNPRLRLLSAASILSYAIGESAWMFRSAFVAQLWPVWALGIGQMIANVTGAIGFYFAGPIIRRFGEFRLLVWASAFTDIVNFLAVLAPSALSPLIMSQSVTWGVNMVAIGGLLQREFTDEQRATMGSLNSFGGSIVFALFSFLLGALADRIGVTPALLFALGLLFVPNALYWWALSGRSKVEDRTSIAISKG